MIRKLFNWIFKAQLDELKKETTKAKDVRVKLENDRKYFEALMQGFDVSVDVHQANKYSRSWACLSLQGERTDFIKFIDLGERDIREIGEFLRRYERNANIKIDASPQAIDWLGVRRTGKTRRYNG